MTSYLDEVKARAEKATPENVVKGVKGFVKISAETRFLAKVKKTETCWL